MNARASVPTVLAFSPDVALPLGAVVTGKLAFIGSSGSGKTYAVGKLVEDVVAAGAPVVIVDIVGNWWGLRLAADGVLPGLSIPIMGGDRGDVPLSPLSGKLVAETLTRTRASAILDISDFTRADQRRFVADFATHLLALKKKAPAPLLVVWEEVHEIVPQKVMGEEARTVGAVERLVKRGRNYGIGTVLISQRVAAVNKDVLNQTETFLAFQTRAEMDRKTVRAWVEDKRVEAGTDVMDALRRLERGTCYLWSGDSRIAHAGVARVGKKWTFDSTKTPEFGEETPVAGALAPVDLERFKAELAQAIDEHKAKDPEVLRARIRDLEAELRKKPPVAPAPPPDSREVIVEVVKYVDRPFAVPALTTDDVDQVRKVLDGFVTVAKHIQDRLDSASRELARAPVAPPVAPVAPVAPKATPRAVAPVPSKPVAPGGRPGPRQRILDVLAEFVALGIGRPRRSAVAVLSGASPTSSSFQNNLGALRSEGLIWYPTGAELGITEVGAKQARAGTRPTLEGYHQAWLAQLTNPQGAIVNVLVASYPRALPRARIADLTAASATSSSFQNNLGTLRSLGLIDYPDGQTAIATELLFPEGLR